MFAAFTGRAASTTDKCMCTKCNRLHKMRRAFVKPSHIIMYLDMIQLWQNTLHIIVDLLLRFVFAREFSWSLTLYLYYQ